MPKLSLLTCLLVVTTTLLDQATAFNYGLKGLNEDDGGLAVTDVETGIEEIKTIFTNEIVEVKVVGIEWEPSTSNVTGSDILRWEVAVDGVKVNNGTYNLTEDFGERELPDELDVGNLTITSSGRHEITVTLFVDETELSASDEFETFKPGVAIFPLIVVLMLACTTHMVEFSLFFAIFVGSCMVTGNIKDGFKALLEDYILNALADVGHGYVYLFTMFLSGMVRRDNMIVYVPLFVQLSTH